MLKSITMVISNKVLAKGEQVAQTSGFKKE